MQRGDAAGVPLMRCASGSAHRLGGGEAGVAGGEGPSGAGG